MKIKYFKVDASIDQINKDLDEDLKIKNFAEFLDLILDEIVETYHLSRSEFDEDWEFSIVKDFDVIKIKIPEYSSIKDTDQAVSSFLNLLKEEGIYESCITGNSSIYKIGQDWNYKTIDGIELLCIRNKEEKHST
jgi:hypothetical protein